MTTYSVFYNSGMNQAVIALPGYEPTDGGQEIGTFDMNVDEINSQTTGSEISTNSGDHAFIVKAKEVLANHEDFSGNLNNVVFLDKASNAPLHSEENVTSDDMDVAEEGHDPDASSQRGGEVSTAGTDPAETEANGQQTKQERTDEASDTSGDGGKTQGTNESNTSTAATGNAPAPTETVEQLKQRISTIKDKDELQKIYDQEKSNSKRAGALKAIEDRAKEIA